MFEKIAEIVDAAENEIDQLLISSEVISLEIKQNVKEIREKSRINVSALMENLERSQLLEAASFYAAAYHWERRRGQVASEMLKYHRSRYSDSMELNNEFRKHKKDLELRLRQMLKTASQYADNAKQARRKGAAVRHAENIAMRDDIFKWLDTNMAPGMSMDAAAEKMAGKVVPLSFRTVRGHVTTWKKVRSASKA